MAATELLGKRVLRHTKKFHDDSANANNSAKATAVFSGMLP